MNPKRLLALLLSFVLAFSIALPALAQESLTEEPNQDVIECVEETQPSFRQKYFNFVDIIFTPIVVVLGVAAWGAIFLIAILMSPFALLFGLLANN